MPKMPALNGGLFFLSYFLVNEVRLHILLVTEGILLVTEGLLDRAAIMLSESTRSHEGKCEASHRGKGSAKGTEDAK